MIHAECEQVLISFLHNQCSYKKFIVKTKQTAVKQKNNIK